MVAEMRRKRRVPRASSHGGSIADFPLRPPTHTPCVSSTGISRNNESPATQTTGDARQEENGTEDTSRESRLG